VNLLVMFWGLVTSRAVCVCLVRLGLWGAVLKVGVSASSWRWLYCIAVLR
jgi:hypothetical protein